MAAKLSDSNDDDFKDAVGDDDTIRDNLQLSPEINFLIDFLNANYITGRSLEITALHKISSEIKERMETALTKEDKKACDKLLYETMAKILAIPLIEVPDYIDLQYTTYPLKLLKNAITRGESTFRTDLYEIYRIIWWLLHESYNPPTTKIQKYDPEKLYMSSTPTKKFRFKRLSVKFKTMISGIIQLFTGIKSMIKEARYNCLPDSPLFTLNQEFDVHSNLTKDGLLNMMQWNKKLFTGVKEIPTNLYNMDYQTTLVDAIIEYHTVFNVLVKSITYCNNFLNQPLGDYTEYDTVFKECAHHIEEIPFDKVIAVHNEIIENLPSTLPPKGSSNLKYEESVAKCFKTCFNQLLLKLVGEPKTQAVGGFIF